jgi:protein-L-isoaspartate(D-aspartate) O-methyltransferase
MMKSSESKKTKTKAEVKIQPKQKKNAKEEKSVKSSVSAKDKFFATLKKEKISKDIIAAFESVDQKIFFDTIFKSKFYGDECISIGYGMKSDNFLNLARMINYLNPRKDERIFEIGTGSGYSSAILSLLCREVVTVEINEKLAVLAKNRLYDNNYGNIRFFAGDGTTFEENFGKIDSIIIHAACRKRPVNVMRNLKDNGIVILAMGPAHIQQIVTMKNRSDISSLENFGMEYHESGVFSLVEGPYGYDFPVLPLEDFTREKDEIDDFEPPKKSEPDVFLFKPTDGDD